MHRICLLFRLPSVQVVFATTEVAPWSKVGGLGDVMGALPAALAARCAAHLMQNWPAA